MNNQQSAINLSVFFPAYNEEENIEQTVKKAVDVCRSRREIADFEVLIINDGSSDRTGVIADSLSNKFEEVRAIHHPKNRGYGAALKTGLFSSTKEWIVFTDSDGQFDFSEIDKFIKVAQQEDAPDLILGYRMDRADPLIRKVNSKMWGLVVRVLFGLRVRDRACGFKMLKKDVLDKIEEIETEGAVAEDELLVRANKAGFKFAEVGVTHYPRTAGEQTGANPAVILRAFKEIFLLWQHTR